MNINGTSGAGGNAPAWCDGDGLKFRRSSEPFGGGLIWDVSCEVDGRIVRGIATSPTAAYDRAIALAVAARLPAPP